MRKVQPRVDGEGPVHHQARLLIVPLHALLVPLLPTRHPSTTTTTHHTTPPYYDYYIESGHLVIHAIGPNLKV